MSEMNSLIPDLQHLIGAIRAADTNAGSELHGEHHWKCVALTALQLAEITPDVDRPIVFLFGLFHDSQRLDDHHDPDHGRRAAKLVQQFHGEYFSLESSRLQKLIAACAGHVDGKVSRDPTIGTCWDADRLNLWRINIEPRKDLVSTPAAMIPEMIGRARNFEGGTMSWQTLLALAM